MNFEDSDLAVWQILTMVKGCQYWTKLPRPAKKRFLWRKVLPKKATLLHMIWPRKKISLRKKCFAKKASLLHMIWQTHLELCFDTSDISSNPFGLFPILIWNWFVSSTINIHNNTITRCRNIFATREHLLLQSWPQGKLQECLLPHLAACAAFSGGSNPPGKDKTFVKYKSSNLALKLCNITPLSPERKY